MNIPVSSYNLRDPQLFPQNEKFEPPTTMTLPTYLFTSSELQEICRRLRTDQSGSRVACLIRINAKMIELNEIENMRKKDCYCYSCDESRELEQYSYLASMPLEIKKSIAYWVYHLPTDTDDGSESYVQKREQDKGDSLPLNDIRSLASVNRSFYHICRPYLYEWLNFLGAVTDHVKFAHKQIVPSHSDCVKKIWWRISFSELYAYEAECESTKDENWDSLWDPDDRSRLFLEILSACPKLTHLDIDIDKPKDPLSDTKRSSRRRSDGRDLLHKFMEPVSQLTSLTHLSLTVPCHQKYFMEDYLVKIIRNLRQLQSLTCKNIQMTNTTYYDWRDNRQPAPLGAHLAGLPYLTRLVLKEVRCFEESWTQLKWLGPLEELSLINCPKITVSLFHAFTKLFASTLLKLETYNVPSEPSWTANPELQESLGGLEAFELPKLISLKTSQNLSIKFIRAFYTSRRLAYLSLDNLTSVKDEELVKLMQDRIWSNLHVFELAHRYGSNLPLDKQKELELICQTNGIEMEFNGYSIYDEDLDEPAEEEVEDETDEEEEYPAGYWEY